MSQYPESVLVYCDIKRINSLGKVSSEADITRSIYPPGDIFNTLLFTDNVITTPSQAMVRKTAPENTDVFQEQLTNITVAGTKAHYDDFHLWLDLFLMGPFIFLPEPLALYRRHHEVGSTISRADFGRLLDRYYIYKSFQKTIYKRNNPHLKASFNLSFYDTSMDLTWFCRQKKQFKPASEAYLQSIRLKPFSYSKVGPGY